LLVTAIVVSISPILVTLMMEAIRSSEKSVLTRASQHNVPEDGILQGCDMLKILHCLYNHLRDGGEVVSFTRLPLLFFSETLFFCF
jgi:hypothetical protein